YDQRMVELVKVIDNITFNNLDTRLIDYLKARQASTGSALIKASHREIALDLNASREGISRLMRKLEQIGVVEQVGRNTIKILASV
ncbi:MAG: helix-turn-helix domain-containing protein, partial [Bacteroidetes bacterium]